MAINRLSRSDVISGRFSGFSKGMHVVSENSPHSESRILPSRYNLRQPDGTIKKYTVYDNGILIQTLQKIGNKYKRIMVAVEGAASKFKLKY